MAAYLTICIILRDSSANPASLVSATNSALLAAHLALQHFPRTMTFAARRRSAHRAIILDKSLEALPVFRLSDSADESAISYSPPSGGRWRVLPNPGDRLPGTFDQDVYVEILRRYSEAGFPSDGMVSFTLHAFLRSIGRRVDGRTYEQLRSAFNRLEKTTLESSGVYFAARANTTLEGRFTILSSVAIERPRL